MKNRIVPIIAALAAFPITASAATIFNGGDLATDGNWTNNRPTTVGNFGTVNVNGTFNAAAPVFNQTFFFEQTGGVISPTGFGADPTLTGGTFTQKGGTWGTSSGRGLILASGNLTTLQSGSIIGGTNGGLSIRGSTMTINGGAYTQYGTNRGVLLTTGGSLTINGGSLTTVTTSATNIFGIDRLATGNNVINLNGGTTIVNYLGFGKNNSGSQLTINIGGTTAGSFTAVDFVALSADELIGERAFAWSPGSLMTFSITNEADWAEIEWAAGRMKYNGQGVGVLGNWATVTTTGFGDGSRFNYDASTNTLSIVPEPASLAVLGLGGLLMLGRRGRRNG